jgi:hypothetical protein
VNREDEYEDDTGKRAESMCGPVTPTTKTRNKEDPTRTIPKTNDHQNEGVLWFLVQIVFISVVAGSQRLNSFWLKYRE